MVGPDVIIGNNCKLQNNVSVYEGVTLEDGVFCGPSMVFTNIYNPRAEIRKMDQVRPTLVKKGATIGANATIVCGVTLGRYSFIGAGTIVNKSGEANWLGLRMRRAADRRSGLPCLRQAVCKKGRGSGTHHPGNGVAGVRCQKA
jgi:UDP-3-O-[3-hydroxymyristoyl] glucosamine N-acyltransferase